MHLASRCPAVVGLSHLPACHPEQPIHPVVPCTNLSHTVVVLGSLRCSRHYARPTPPADPSNHQQQQVIKHPAVIACPWLMQAWLGLAGAWRWWRCWSPSTPWLLVRGAGWQIGGVWPQQRSPGGGSVKAAGESCAGEVCWTACSPPSIARQTGCRSNLVFPPSLPPSPLPGPFRNWRATVMFCYATCTAFLIPLTNE